MLKQQPVIGSIPEYDATLHTNIQLMTDQQYRGFVVECIRMHYPTLDLRDRPLKTLIGFVYISNHLADFPTLKGITHRLDSPLTASLVVATRRGLHSFAKAYVAETYGDESEFLLEYFDYAKLVKDWQEKGPYKAVDICAMPQVVSARNISDTLPELEALR